MRSIVLLTIIAFALIEANSFSFPAIRQNPSPLSQKRQSEGVISTGYSWIGNIQVGSQQQNFRVLLDTGSGTLGVYGAMCQACNIPGSSLFNPASSSSFRLLQCTGSGCVCNARGECFTTAVYGDGTTWTGVIGKDDLTIGGWTGAGGFAYMINASKSYVDGTNDGILGLTYPNFGFPDSPIQDIITEKEAPNMFWLGFNTNGTGVMTIGSPIADYYVGEMSTLQVYPTAGNAYGWYVVRPQQYTVGNHVIGNAAAFGGLTIVDSGTTFLLLPDAVYNTFAQTLRTSYATLPCLTTFLQRRACTLTETQKQLWPNMTFAFAGNVELTLTPDDYIIVGNAQGQYGLAIDTIGSVNANSVGCILGEPFFSGRYMGFDRTQNVIRFAKSSGYTGIHNGDVRLIPIMISMLIAVIMAL